jgi:hypothetical protein
LSGVRRSCRADGGLLDLFGRNALRSVSRSRQRSSTFARMRDSSNFPDARGPGSLQHPYPALLGAQLTAHAGDLVAHPLELPGSHSADRSSGTSPNFRISLASPSSPVAASPVRLNASAGTARVCTENLIRAVDVMESPKLAE